MDQSYLYGCDMEIQDALGDGQRPSLVVAVDQVIRGRLRLGFHERPVGGGHGTLPKPHGCGVHRIGEPAPLSNSPDPVSPVRNASCLRPTALRSLADMLFVCAGSLYISTMYFMLPPHQLATVPERVS
jgi:hypothetical protein